jgi:hypothetical protein
MLSQLKHKGECPECGKDYEKPPSGAFRVVCRDCRVVFDGEECRKVKEVLEETQRSCFGI